MQSREINKLKKMRENIIRQHTDSTNSTNGKRWRRNWNRVVQIDRQLKLLKVK